jgi:hypothetical protein
MDEYFYLVYFSNQSEPTASRVLMNESWMDGWMDA